MGRGGLVVGGPAVVGGAQHLVPKFGGRREVAGGACPDQGGVPSGLDSAEFDQPEEGGGLGGP